MSFLATIPVNEFPSLFEISQLGPAKKTTKTIMHLEDAEGAVYKRSPRPVTLFFIDNFVFSVALSSGNFIYPDYLLEKYFADSIHHEARGPPAA